jgi:NAD(P)H-nitrite reductase large subunit
MNIVVIGSGIAGFSFADEYRKLCPEASVTIVTRETGGYYSRPLLSHGFTHQDIESRIMLRTFDQLEQSGIHVTAGCEVTRIDRERQSLSLINQDLDDQLHYDHLVLALGSDAIVPPPLLPYAAQFHILNSLDDLLELRRIRERVIGGGEVPRWAIIGGGLIGCELASDLAVAGDQTTLFHVMPRLMERQLAEADSNDLLQLLTEVQHIDVRLDTNVQGISGKSGNLTVHASSGDIEGFHCAVVACGFKPRIDLARKAELGTGRGIKVNAFLTTTDPHISAIGDAAECENGKNYAYVTPIRSQAIWLARHLTAQSDKPWETPDFNPRAKVHGFTAKHPYVR